MGSSGRWELQGVVSFGAPGCGDTSQPSVFARVPLLKNWIVQNSGYNNDNNNNNDNDKPVPIHQTTSLE
jgi:secreted trypsin-like serine protease